jgi:purine-binding chemotaxis protein CheW
MEVLVFQVGGDRYGIDLRCVSEVVAAVRVTPLPGAPAVVEGVVDVRGRLAAVFDLRKRFRMAPRAPQLSERLVLANTGERLVAFRCDDVQGLAEVDDSVVEDARNAVPGVEHIIGVIRLEGGLVLIHDLATFLSEAEAEALDSAMKGEADGIS